MARAPETHKMNVEVPLVMIDNLILSGLLLLALDIHCLKPILAEAPDPVRLLEPLLTLRADEKPINCRIAGLAHVSCPVGE
ncbi:hypothetical protein NDU88_006317 [Pleurodeles waltl]|uniref:Uncharacterized protein n=1 Tax=Pleurodeles waltl TaxID=8319 RepID=A0AAV7PM30_PLEWA|nr:hypothetical protein NDU88_006317 [Pleurodeles waltl]